MAKTAAKAKTKAKPATKAKADKPKFDLYAAVTDKIVASLEAGVRPWQQPWTGTGGVGMSVRPLRHNGESYRGLNVIMLWAEQMAKGYNSAYWMTFQQAIKYKANVKKGEKGTAVYYASFFETKPTDGSEPKKLFNWRFYFVFNADQIEGLPERFYAKPEPVFNSVKERDVAADAYFAAIGSRISYGGTKAYYRPSDDVIRMPLFEDFHDAGAFYATLGHESVHWTGAKTRLEREFDKFGTEAYAAEELVAEIGAAFLCADLGLSIEPREDHAQYVAGWLKVLKGDKRFIFTAASRAQKAVEFLHEAAGEAAPVFAGPEIAEDVVEDEQAVAA